MKKQRIDYLRQVHPTPQWVRERFLSLDGLWKLNGHQILVPYPPQSPMSGYRHHVGFHLHYQKKFSIPINFQLDRILLHFGGVDQVCDVYLNEHFVGHHEGGYLEFCFDVTKYIKRRGENRLSVAVTDRLSHMYPYGKQRFARGGMWYTPVSGIWKTVWLENVPSEYLERVHFHPTLTGFAVECVNVPEHGGENSPRITLHIPREQGSETYQYLEPEEDHAVTWKLEEQWTYIDMRSIYETLNLTWDEEQVLWSPEHPHLFNVTLTYGQDRVESYVALREIGIKEYKGVSRVCLNGHPIFLQGVLDQGYFPEGIYVPEGNRAYDRDIQSMKELGCNFLRKHIKVEPEYFYYAADRLGMLVMQDMVNSGPYHFLGDTLAPNITFKKRFDTHGKGLDRHRKEFFIQHCYDTVEQLRNHPSIISWCIFNEGWGQFESDRLYRLFKEWDPERLVDSTSGWFAQNCSDFHSEHIYFHNEQLLPKERPLLLSECGGFGYAIEGHRWDQKKSTGYGMADSTEALMDRIRDMYIQMIYPAIAKGLCGVVYTQLCDVEEEINGIYTYDRQVCKVDPVEMQLLAKHCRDMLETNCT